jgi:hypothetical protein
MVAGGGWVENLKEEPLSQVGGWTRTERVSRRRSIWMIIAVSIDSNTPNDDDRRLFDERKEVLMGLW